MRGAIETHTRANTHNGRKFFTQSEEGGREGGAEREELATCVNLPGLGDDVTSPEGCER